MINSILITVQMFFTIVTGMYFLTQLRSQRYDKDGISEDAKAVMERLNKMRKISLSPPLSEQVRPKNLDEIVGQDDGLLALKIALGGKNPQHILIYGPPGVGKTAASRVAMEYAKKSEGTPFKKDAKFIEVDATIMQYDERSIADPLVGSVHDPIYQGAGSYGPGGIPQPKEGAVSKAHGGVLFIDEIGELNPMQMNRLLKVLEDRKVRFESSYYSSTNKNIPPHIHEVFKNGIPADFRLIGATTRSPDQIPPALRSRCTEIFFDSLNSDSIKKIIDNTLKKLDFSLDEELKDIIAQYSQSGRDTVSILQTLSQKLNVEKRTTPTKDDVMWIIDSGRYSPVYSYKADTFESVGKVNALAVGSNHMGIVIPIEVAFNKIRGKTGSLYCGGICENETIKHQNKTLMRTSMAKGSVDNVLCVLDTLYDIDCKKYDIHINVPGGVPVDGPSAGAAIFAACYSSINNIGIPGDIAITGEVSIKGEILPVGGVKEKITAAKNAGCKVCLIPSQNMCDNFGNLGIEIICCNSCEDIIKHIFTARRSINQTVYQDTDVLVSAEENI